MRTRFILSLVGRITPLTIAFIFAVLAPDTKTKGVAYACAVVLLIVSEYFGIYRPLQNLDETRRKQLDHYLKAFVDSAKLEDQKAVIRVNVMVVGWTITGRRFFQFYQCGMKGYPDANLHFAVSKGVCCGMAFKRRLFKVEYADLRGPNLGYKLSKREVETTGHVKAVATIPLFREVKTLRGNPNEHYFGVLNVDAIDDVGAELLKEPKIQDQIKGHAEFIRITLA